MSRKKRKVFGVISANSYDIEQREILSGAIEKVKSLNIGIAVISNIYNPTETVDVLKPENKIYDLILSDVFDGFILISESITNRDIQHQIEMNLLKKQNIPIVVIGTHFPDSLLTNSHFINTSDKCDVEDICDHLIEVHNLDEIHILTGHDYIKTSLRRVSGFRNSLEKHDVGYNKNKVFFGDFGLNSGREQAQKYISGELPYPQALICCNDYMAFGLLDEFMEQNVKIPETMTIIGYEWIG